MSSPIALPKRAAPRRALVRLHRRLAHTRRVQVLAERLAATIDSLGAPRPTRCLDVGCGDMTLAEAIHDRAPHTKWRCIDVHSLPAALARERRWKKYRRFDGRTIPYAARTFDVVLLCDVLHHAQNEAGDLLREARRVGARVIVKDHFEHGRWSRLMLRLMDFVGNWGYGIGVPRRYYTPDSFAALVRDSGLAIESLARGVDLYAHLPLAGLVLRPEWQFIAVLEPAPPEPGRQ